MMGEMSCPSELLTHVEKREDGQERKPVDPALRASVCIPSYRRPEYLRRAVLSVLAQTRKADEIIVVSRENDDATNDMIARLVDENPHINIRNLRTTVSGFLPPVRIAVNNATGDIIAFLDDDAEAHITWLQKLLAHYKEESVGGVGGRVVNYYNGVLQMYSVASVVGQLSWYGKSVGNMYRDVTFDHPVDVVHLMGGNMSYRAELFRACLPDERLGNNAAFYWEMDVGLQVKGLGYRIIYDPTIKVDHHSGPRALSGMRTINASAIYWSNFNYALIMRRYLSRPRFLAFLVYTSLVGGSSAPGLVYATYAVIRGKPLSWSLQIRPSVAGRWAGIWA